MKHTFIGLSALFIIFFIHTKDVHANPAPRIELTNTQQNEIVHSPVLLVKGRIRYTCQPDRVYPNQIDLSGRFIRVFYNGVQDQASVAVEKKWPVSSNHEFTFLIKLRPGQNELTFTYEYLSFGEFAQLKLIINYIDNVKLNLVEPLHLAILVASDSNQTFDVDTSQEGSNLKSAIKRLQTLSRLTQALISNGLSNQRYLSFDEDLLISPKVHVIKSLYSTSEIQAAKTSQSLDTEPSQVPENHLRNLVIDSIESHSQLYNLKSRNKPLNVLCIILDTHWDHESRTLFGHSAFGGGVNDIKLALYGSHLLHSIPESLDRLLPTIVDNSSVNSVYNTIDNSLTKFKSFDLFIGDVLIQIGSLLGLEKNENGLLNKQVLQIHRNFLSIELTSENKFVPVRGEKYNNEEVVFSRLDAITIALHPIFKLPGDLTFDSAGSSAPNILVNSDNSLVIDSVIPMAVCKFYFKNELLSFIDFDGRPVQTYKPRDSNFFRNLNKNINISILLQNGQVHNYDLTDILSIKPAQSDLDPRIRPNYFKMSALGNNKNGYNFEQFLVGKNNAQLSKIVFYWDSISLCGIEFIYLDEENSLYGFKAQNAATLDKLNQVKIIGIEASVDGLLKSLKFQLLGKDEFGNDRVWWTQLIGAQGGKTNTIDLKNLVSSNGHFSFVGFHGTWTPNERIKSFGCIFERHNREF